MSEPVALTLGDYQARGLIAEAQRCVNLYGEPNPKGAPFPFTFYPTPGLTLISTPPTAGFGRGLYRSSTGLLYAAVGSTLYSVSINGAWTALGTISNLSTPVSMSDNGQQLVVVDGTGVGYQVLMSTGQFSTISDPNFQAAVKAAVLDDFLIFVNPVNGNVFCTYVNQVVFDGLYYQNKTGYPDLVQTCEVAREFLWVIGSLTSEVWYDAGNTGFPFTRLPGVFVEFGIAATYSLAKADESLFWLSQNKEGQAIVLATEKFSAKRISTFALEDQFATYAATFGITDAVGYCYQQGGHTFYVLSFPSANATWVFDVTNELWHQRVWIDTDGNENRHRGIYATNCYGRVNVLDWQTGALYYYDRDNYTDNGTPIVRRRGFPHLVVDGRKVEYTFFRGEVQCGEDSGAVDGSSSAKPPQIYLRWSDDRGRTWGNPIAQSLGAQGQYGTFPLWMNLGMSRDRVFELFWSVPTKTALNGAFIDPISCEN